MARARITLGLALVITVLAVIGRAYPVVALPLLAAAIFLIVWGRAGRATEQVIGSLPGGGYILKFLHQIDLIISPRDQEFERHLKSLIAGYPLVVRASLAKLTQTRSGASVDSSHWQQFRHDGLVDHPHSGPGPIKEDLREMVGRILDELG
jgi:hypothetical protein